MKNRLIVPEKILKLSIIHHSFYDIAYDRIILASGIISKVTIWRCDMHKKLVAILVLLVLILSTVPVSAANIDRCDGQKPVIYKSIINERHDEQNPVVYKSTIKVTEDGGTYQVGFVTVKFPKGFISSKLLPIRIDVEISAVRGVAGIEFTPDILNFNKDVTIYVQSYQGLLYDRTSGKNIKVNIKNQVFKVKHFSRYAFS